MSCPLNEKNSIPSEGKVMYDDYLMLDKVLNAQRMLSADEKGKNPAFDEHLFIIIHQTYELWFKEILYELDIARDEFSKEKLNFSEVIKRLNRIVMILKLLVDQVLILETMSPMDFNDFRQHLGTASGFQSMQFRLIENKLGMRNENRSAKFNQNYSKVFTKDESALDEINKSLSTPSLLQLIDKWLEKTPHMNVLWKHYKQVVETRILNNVENGIILDEDLDVMLKDDTNDAALKKIREQFETVFDSSIHEALVKRGERKMSFKALHAAIIINLYKDDAIFSASHQILTLLVDIDSMLSRWRYNHVLLVQRMIGSMLVGTGGSSGYQYLRSTLSDRYKPFVDLSNLTTFLVSKNEILPLNRLITADNHNEDRKKGRKSARRENVNGKRSCNGRLGYKDGGMQRCLHCAKINGNPAKICNVCIESNDFQDLTMNSTSEDEKKELESSYESTSSTSSTLNN